MPNRARNIELHFPMGGLEKKLAYQKQAPFTTPDCQNVRPDGTIEGRERGGSRPGLSKAYDQRLDLGLPYVFPITFADPDPVRMLNSVTVTKDDGFRYWIDSGLSDEVGTRWSQPSWLSDKVDIFPENLDDLVYEEENGAVLDELENFDQVSKSSVEIYVLPYESDTDVGEAHHGEYHLYAAMDNSAPNVTTGGFEAILTMTGNDGAFSIELKHDGVSVDTFVGAANDNPLSGWFTILVGAASNQLTGTFPITFGESDIKVYWQGAEIISYETESSYAGSRVGFGMKCTEAGGVNLVNTFRVQYHIDIIDHQRRTLLVASAGKRLYREDFLGTLVELQSLSTDVNDIGPLASVERLQKLYICDRGEPREQGDDADLDNFVLSDEDVSDWSNLGIDVNGDVCTIFNGQGSVVDGSYGIASVETTGITLTDDPGDGTCSFRVERAPKIYDPSDDSLVRWEATTGAVPPGCLIGTLYRDRLVLAGDVFDPHNWYMSRQGDPLDWNYGADANDVGRAVAGNNTQAGRIGEPVTALIAHSDDYLLMGGTHSLWVVRGDPAYDGQIDNLSEIAGVVSGNAWCSGPNGETIFLSLNGLYILPAGANAFPQNFSRVRLPRALLDIDRDLVDVTMAFDTRDEGIHLYITQKETNDLQNHWWFDWSTRSFWPVRLQPDHEPTALYFHKSEASEEGVVLLGGRDSWIRRYRDTSATDDGSLIESHVLYGPFRPGGNGWVSGELLEMTATLAQNSVNVAWGVITGDSHEAVVKNAVVESGTWKAGLNYKVRPDLSAGSIGVKVSSTSKWSVEGINAVIKSNGEQRSA